MADRRSTTTSRRGRAAASRRRARPLATRTRRPRRRRRTPTGPWARIRNTLLTVLAIVVFGGAAFALARAAGLMPSGLDLSVLATWGTIEQQVTGRAFVVRQETLATAAVAGTVRPRVAEGERVRPGQALVDLVDLASARDIEARLIELDRQIVAAQAAAEGATAADPQAAAQAAEAYRQALSDMGQVVVTGRIAAFADSWTVLTAAARQRAIAQDRVADRASALQDLITQRTEMLNALQAKSTPLLSDRQAIVTFRLDGLEDRDLATVEATDPGALLRWRESPAALNAASRVEAGDAVCKLVDPNLAWLAMVLPADRLAATEVGDTVAARFPGLGESIVRGRVNSLGAPQRNGTRMVTVAIESVPTALARNRWFDTELLLLSRSGVVVPRSVLVTREGQTGIYVLSRTSAYFKPVTVLAGAGGDVLIQGIAAGTAVARMPWLWSLLGRVR